MYTYLIIDDETLIRKGTIKKLSPLADKITCCGEAENGQEGIEMVRQFHPDLVILDMQMPVMDGMQLLPYLSEHFPDIALIVISGHQNFDYIKQALASKAIDYILKPFSREEIQKTVLSVIGSLQTQKQTMFHVSEMQEEKEAACYQLDLTLLCNLILGYEAVSDKISSCRLDYINHAQGFILYTLYFCQLPSELPDLQQWLDGNGPGTSLLFLPNSHNPHFAFIIQFFSGIPGEDPDYNTGAFSEKLLHWMNQRQISLYLGISCCHSSIVELHEAFSETCEALNTQEVSNKNIRCFSFRELLAPIVIHWKREDELLFRIESGNAKDVSELTEELFLYYRSIPHCTLTDVKYHCQQIGGECRNILNYYLNQQISLNGVSHNMQTIVNTLFSLDDLKEYYLQFFLNITNMIRSQSVYVNNDLIDQIQIYMHRNYQKDLTQEYLASLFYLNRSYLSELFRKKTGEKFVDYLNNIRIEKAQELLRNTDRKAYTIAKSVGYENTKYFFRIFKRKTGLSPEQYRRQTFDSL